MSFALNSDNVRVKRRFEYCVCIGELSSSAIPMIIIISYNTL